MLKVRVKIDHIQDLHAARYCAGMGVEFLGFSLDTANLLSLEQYLEIRAWLAGVKWVINVYEIDQVVDYKDHVDALELSSESHIELCNTYGLPLFYRFKPKDKSTFQIYYDRYVKYVEGFLIDLDSQDLEDLASLKFLTEHDKVFLTGRFSSDEVKYMIENTDIGGLSLQLGKGDNLESLVNILEYLDT